MENQNYFWQIFQIVKRESIFLFFRQIFNFAGPKLHEGTDVRRNALPFLSFEYGLKMNKRK